jgi:hypothetical protein
VSRHQRRRASTAFTPPPLNCRASIFRLLCSTHRRTFKPSNTSLTHNPLQLSVTMSSAPTAKLEPTKSNEADPAKASKPATTNPALLEEDDEFEDFPIEGTQVSLSEA